jgi:excisionase family DNA binding protein
MADTVRIVHDSAMPTYDRRLRSAKQLGEDFGVSTRTIYQFVDQGLLRPSRVGRRLLRFSEEDIKEFLRRSSEVADEA